MVLVFKIKRTSFWGLHFTPNQKLNLLQNTHLKKDFAYTSILNSVNSCFFYFLFSNRKAILHNYIQKIALLVNFMCIFV